MRDYISYTILLLLFAIVAKAQNNKQIIIETDKTALVFTIGTDNKIYQSYFGARFTRSEAYINAKSQAHEAYVASGMTNQFEPAIRVVHADGNPSLDLRYADSKQITNGDVVETSIIMKDPKYPVEVVLHLSAYKRSDVFKSWTSITHAEKKPLAMYNYASCILHFDAPAYYLTQFHGDWSAEMNIEESKLTSGIKIIDSKLGTRAQTYQTPVFLLSLDKRSTEDDGEVIAGTLAWSGNFQLLFEIGKSNELRVISGINPHAAEYHLEAGKTFNTPEFIFTYSKQGRGATSRNLQHWARNYGVLDGNKPRQTLLNNWEATYFDFNEQKLSELFGYGRQLGIDVFLLDDGWFGNKYPRNDDHAGLGDWQVNKKKLPNGIAHLVKDAENNGIKFGIWVEPEMVNPKSELYEKHPDWILRLPNREEDYARNQLVLDLTNPKVQDFVYGVVNDLMTKNPGIAYIKWDCNRAFTNAYSPYLKNQQSHLTIEYVRGLYNVLDRVRVKYPALAMMLCSSGGGRTDYGALKYFQEFWPSDNTDGLERVYIQWGYSYFYPAVTLASHVTSWGKQPIKFKTDVAMMGRLGYDLDVKTLSAEELEFSKQALVNYKQISKTIWSGDQYRLVSPYEERRAALMYVDSMRSKAVLFCYNLITRHNDTFNYVRLKGLDAGKRYRITEVSLMPGTKSELKDNEQIYTGEYLMNIGLSLNDSNQLKSWVVVVNEV